MEGLTGSRYRGDAEDLARVISEWLACRATSERVRQSCFDEVRRAGLLSSK